MKAHLCMLSPEKRQNSETLSVPSTDRPLAAAPHRQETALCGEGRRSSPDSDRSGEAEFALNELPAALGVLSLVGAEPAETMTLNRYFFEQIALQSETDEVRPENFLSCLHPGDRERCKADFHALLSERGPMTRQYRFCSARTGDYCWYSVRADIRRNAGNKELVWFVFTDIDEMKKTEITLRESQRCYRRMLDATQTATWTYDIPKRRVVMGDNAATLALRKKFDWPRVFENVPVSTLDFIDEHDREKYLAMFREIDAGHDISCDFWYKQRTGMEPFCARETYSVVFDEDGKPVLAYGIGQNITAQKKLEQRYSREMDYLRRNSEESLISKGHYNLTKNTVLEYDINTQKNIFICNPGASYDEVYEEMLKMPCSESERREIAEKLNRTNLIRRYQQGENHTSLQYRRVLDGQEPIWVYLTVHAYMGPDTGDLELFSYAYDITRRKLNETIMNLISEETFDYIGLIFAETNQFEFVVKSPDILFPDLRQRTSYNECCDYVRRNFVNEDEREQFDSAVSLDNILAELLHKDRCAASYRRIENGQLLCKQLDYVWLDKENKIILVVRSDVTTAFSRNRKQLAEIQAAKLEAEKANEAKSAFLANMSHDLRTPLNGVLGFTTLALAESSPEKKQDYLKKIDSSGRLLLDLLNDTLELSRIESGKNILEPEAVLPENLIPAVVTALRPSAELKNIHLKIDYPTDELAPLWCDKLKVQKIALNLISNAIKYTPEGGTVSVSVQHGPDDKAVSVYRLVVEDTGIGMSEEFLKRMYEPFSQEKRSEMGNVLGTGLGLAIVKRYVDLMGGEISAESQIHKGTRFVVTLPISKLGEGQRLQKRETARINRAFDGKHVLLCEDNYMNTEIAVTLLREKGIEVECAENGKEGLDKFSASAVGYYDAILMDIRMPVMDGFEAAEKLRSLDRTDAKTVPVIAMTADAFEESIRAAREAGMNAYVTKPIEPNKLYAVLAEAF